MGGFRFSASSFTFRPLPVLQAGDLVEFRVGTVVKTGEKRAVEVKPTRSRLRSKVTAVKGEVSSHFLKIQDKVNGIHTL